MARIETDLRTKRGAAVPDAAAGWPSGRIAAIGDSCIDSYSGGRRAVGGNALNVAINLARLGLDAEYAGVIGDDAAGRQIRDALSESGVAIDHVQMKPGPSWVSYISVRADGLAVVEREEPGVAGPYAPTAEELERLATYRHVHFANLADAGLVLATLAPAATTTSYDYGSGVDPEKLGPSDIAFFSYAGADGATGARLIARRALLAGAGLAVVTMGANGSLADDGDRIRTVPAVPIRPVDTLGAGDSYLATFIARWLAGSPIDDAMDTAGRAASRTCLHWAAWPQELPLKSVRTAT